MEDSPIYGWYNTVDATDVEGFIRQALTPYLYGLIGEAASGREEIYQSMHGNN